MTKCDIDKLLTVVNLFKCIGNEADRALKMKREADLEFLNAIESVLAVAEHNRQQKTDEQINETSQATNNKTKPSKMNGIICKWISDDFSEICCNADSPAVGDFCPCANYPGLCKHSELVEVGDNEE